MDLNITNVLLSKLKKLDEIISEINSKLDYIKYLTPINLREENDKFIEAFKSGKKYNPHYMYLPYENIDFEGIAKQISKFKLSTSSIERIFKRYILFLENLISMYQNRGNSFNFTKFSIKAFGLPDNEVIEKAYAFLKKSIPAEVDIKEATKYDVHDLAEKLRKRIDKYGFDWKLVILDSSTTKVTVDPEVRTIYLNGSINYSDRDLKRFSVHEIDTHVLRSENGRIQPFRIFSTGLANSLLTEEGLAVVSEEKANVSDQNILRLYAGRAIGVSLSRRATFYDIFSELINYLSEQDALYITQRIKKGLSQTSEYGGFTKDYIYFAGYYKVKEFLMHNDSDILFVGSIGLEDIPEVEELMRANIIMKPRIIPNYLGEGRIW